MLFRVAVFVGDELTRLNKRVQSKPRNLSIGCLDLYASYGVQADTCHFAVLNPKLWRGALALIFWEFELFRIGDP
ncbi:hypothetical protein R1flu_014617 [Riccia fluitans]|uniref:Uncharacterized protein n=1 Tax=Riccia fluitans TaxID=41844 RepID=A0ABD1YGZ8_9MARC